MTIGARVSYGVLTLFLAMSTVFFAVRLSPGDPVERILGPRSTLEERNQLAEQLGVNKSVTEQYVKFIGGVIKGDLGKSLFKKAKVTELIVQRLAPTLELALYSLLLSTLIGIALGAVSAWAHGKSIDSMLRVISLCFLSIPIFSLAPLLVILFSIKLDLLPVSEWNTWQSKILPVVTLVIPLSSILLRVMRNRLLEEKSQMWTTVLAAKGMNDLSIFSRLIKVSLPTVLTVVGIQMSVVLAGTMITEIIFDIPGIGSLLFESIQNRDYPLVQGIIAYSTIVYMVVYFFIDFANEKIDPRIGRTS